MPARLNTLIESSPALRSFAQAARQVHMLQHHFKTIVPAPLGQSSRVTHYADGRLTLEAYNGAVAGKLRQLTPQIISSFRTMGCEVTGIQIRVQASTPPGRATVRPRSLGPQGRQALSALAEELPADSPLKSVLERMVRRTR